MSATNQNYPAPQQEPQPGGEREAPRAKPKSRKRRRRPVVLTIIIRFFQMLGTLLLVGVVTGSFLICYAAVYVKTVVMPKTDLDLSAYTMNENSVIYYEDKYTGQLVELQTLMGTENREIVAYEDIPEDLINAIVAIEDKRFWTHQGVDWKRTGAGLIYMFTGHNIQGGSTITQQLIKNLTEYDDVTVTRKILEIFTALELENNYQKEEILETYLNYIYLGNGCHGVQAAAKYYFGKDVSQLTLAECASLAGITNNPSLYAPYGVVDVVRYQCQNPECKLYSLTRDDVCEYCGTENSYDSGTVWTNREFNKARQETILAEMAKVDEKVRPVPYITEAERDAAIAQPLVFTRDKQNAPADPDNPDQPVSAGKDAKSSHYSWYVEAVIDEALSILKEEYSLSDKAAGQRVFSGGLRIIVPYDPEIQAAVDEVYNNRENLDQVSKTGQRLASAITVVDNSSGYVVAVGNTMEKTLDRGLNMAVHSKRQPGSSIKPLSVYSPALEMGLITPASVFDDNPFLLNGKVWPTNAPAVYKGLTTVLDAVTRSVNTVAVRVLDQVTPQESFNYMTERYGFTSLEAYRLTNTGEVLSDINRSPLALGGLTKGVSTYEMAAAYATFPRNGAFTPATTVLEIQDADGRLIVDNRPDSKFVIQSKTSYYINSMLTNAVNTGTGYNARISGQTVAGKTGTTNDWYDLWFCGYTSYYTAAVWTGYPDYNEVINQTGYNPSVTLWQKVMSIIHQEKENQAFGLPEGLSLSSYSVCMDCGNLSTADCESDVRGSRAQTFRLVSGDGPREYCSCHVPVTICTESPITTANGTATGAYHQAGEFCPEESVKQVTMVNFQREMARDSLSIGDQYALISLYDHLGSPYCAVHTSAPEPSDPVEPIDPFDPSPSPDVTDWPYVPPTAEPSYDPFAPPSAEPSYDPFAPPSAEPSYDPFLPPIVEPTPEQPYIPADQNTNTWW